MSNNNRAILVIAALLLAAPEHAQTGVAVTSEKIQRIEAFIASEMTTQKIPGLTLAIGIDGAIVYSKAFGLADLENSVPMKTTTVLRTASVAKPMTATAVMQLVEAGKIDIGEPIRKYCPAFPEKQWPVTVRQLLAHQGGVRHYQKPGESSGTEHFFTLVDSLRVFKDDPLLHEPGTKFHYTTYGYSLLGCAIEGSSGKSYEQYMADHVFGPAGMSRTRADNHFEIIPDRARGYLRLDQETYKTLPDAAKAFARVGDVYNAQLHDTSMKIPGGGFLSTSEDLVRFVFALRNGKLVKPETLEQMWSNQKTTDGIVTAYGLGWNVPPSEGGKSVLHGGGQAGTSTIVGFRRDKNVAIGLMCNVDGVATNRLLGRIGAILLDGAQ